MARILDSIREPADLRKLTEEELSILAMEIRALILETVAKNGGHLGSNLGVVELTLALHKVFDSPRDKIVWDVGHQCYTHKILTGRKDRFGGLRRCGGILGFPCREESEHDAFNTGHASTALSAALGMAVARDKAGEKHHVIAVVGDGSLTGGVALEALNQIGHLRERLIIVLNFNEMSISINVGAWSKYFSYLVSGQRYIQIKDQAKSLLKRVPQLGWPVIKAGRALEELVKKTLFPGLVFKELGIRYIGPVHGHNIQSLVEAFETAKTYDGPILIQCVTQKGKGYEPARTHPEKFHGAGPFQVSTGEPLKREWGPSFSSVFGAAMIKIAKKDEKVLAITAAMGEGTGLKEFSEKLPGRFFDVGIAEQHAVTFASGLAVSGFKPVVAIYSTFLQRAYDQVYHDVCLMDLPVVFVLDRAGIVPDDGPTHQGVNDIAYLRHMPNMIVMAPKDENELQHMLWSALAYGHPVSVRFPKAKGLGVPMDETLQVLPPGRSELVKDGRDLLFAFGNMVAPALEAARELEKDDISLAVVNARFAKPLDRDMILRFAQPGGTVITLEEGIVDGGAGSAVRELLDKEERFGIRFKSLGLPIGAYPLGKSDEIRTMVGLDVPGLVRQIKDFYQTPLSCGGDERTRG
ncbi:MAG: 1-deoxy-D-xylulose-5-phosphate synthase [Candidatus Aminicenantes bacterium RBG_16_63_14]|nr:MAG: 1-deoxy-D-xylulose-5-phosphate synthase [Candidatus Aminicenantes bacterium RBG_16_63_14]OGD26742.1 MAG: 1-deoxy-D-xylulose-5-phosphate synthase [Candidatus Aminicenantes bacterium RBG_19FT_COMBO_65_30]